MMAACPSYSDTESLNLEVGEERAPYSQLRRLE